MKKNYLFLVFVFSCLLTLPAYAAKDKKSASQQAQEHASEKAVFNRVGDWFATIGKSEEEKEKIKQERKAIRAQKRAEKEAKKAQKRIEQEEKRASQEIRKQTKDAQEKGKKIKEQMRSSGAGKQKGKKAGK